MSENPGHSGVKRLDELLMTTGSVNDIVKDTTWPKVAVTLQEAFLPIQRSLKTPEEQAGYYVTLCTVYYMYGKKRVIWTGNEKNTPADHLRKSDLDDLVDFIENFMKGNGQWDYIQRQDWFLSGRYAIGIDVNYYPDRSGFTAFLAFHKDTGGNNIFVNLVFDNTTVIEATEWYVDTADPSKLRQQWQAKLLPESYLKDLGSARAALRKGLDGKDPVVAGGVSPHKYTYVSWVDDLVWHSTPYGNKRTEYGLEHAERAYPMLAASKTFSYVDEQLGGLTILGTELLGTIAEADGTHLVTWLKQHDLQMQDLGFDLSERAWNALYSGTEGEARFLDDAKRRALLPWRLTGGDSEANAEDPRLPKSRKIDEPPVGLSRLRRTNSKEDIQRQMAEAREAGKGKPRAFIRTWVRILQRTDPELSYQRFTFEDAWTT